MPLKDQGPRPRVLFINRSYWPDAESTGQLLTELCEDLADRFEVTVLAGQPNQNPDQVAFRRRGPERRNGVTIRRVRHTRFPKRFLVGRLVNYLSFLLGALVAALRMPLPDVVVTESDPPLLALIGRVLQRRGAKLVVYLLDIHPDIAVAMGKLRDGRMVRGLQRILHRVYRGADRIVTPGRDMQQRIARAGIDAREITVLPNWIDTTLVRPVKENNGFRQRHGLAGRFLVMYSGNLGLCQQLGDIIAAAGHLRHRPEILFVLVGDGALKASLEEQVRQLGLTNIRFFPYEPKSRLAESLSAADVHLVPLDPRVADCLMPSKLYGVLASGTPLVAIAPEDCELAQLARTDRLGAVAPPGQPEALADVLQAMHDRQADLAAMGRRARQLAEQSFDRRQITARFGDLLWDVLGNPEPSATRPETPSVIPVHHQSAEAP